MTHKALGRPQLRTQVLAGVLAVTLLALAAFDIAAVTALRRYLIDQTHSRLQTVLTMTVPRLGLLVPAAAGPGGVPVIGEYDIAFVPFHGPAVTLEHGPGTAHALPTALAAPRVVPGRQVVATTRYYVAEARVATGTLVAGTSLDEVNGTLGRFKAVVVAGSAAAGLAILLAVVLVMRRGLRPIELMAAEADRITAGDLTDRVSHADPQSEVGRLGAALNGMLARIEASVQEQEASQELMRRFFADASHELRNPLASLRAHAELYAQGALRERPQVDEAMRRIGLEARRMSRLVDDMLRLARLDAKTGRRSDPVDVTALAGGCVARARAADPRRTLRADIAPGLVLHGDDELLRRAVDNLLANVRAHTPPGTLAVFTAGYRGDQVVIEVGDDGPGVPADQLPRVFDRFYRAGAPVTRPGSGLGLAIVAEVAAVHDGTAAAAANDPRGLRVTLSLPVRPAASGPSQARQRRACRCSSAS